jgi:hypothetical protein
MATDKREALGEGASKHQVETPGVVRQGAVCIRFRSGASATLTLARALPNLRCPILVECLSSDGFPA